MKRFFLSLLILFSASVQGRQEKMDSSPDYLDLVVDGKPQATIVLPEKPVKAEKLAAAELKQHIKLITGAELPIINEKQFSNGTGLFLGATQRAKVLGLDQKSLAEQEFVIRTVPDGMLIFGRDKQDVSDFNYQKIERKSGLTTYDTQTWPGWWDEKGTLDAIYSFLRNSCGVRWFDFSDYGTDYLPRKNLSVKQVDIKKKPAFLMRDIYTSRSPADFPGSYLLWSGESDGFQQYMSLAFASIKTKHPNLSARSGRNLVANQVHAYLLRNGNGGTGYFHPNHSMSDYYARFWQKDPRFLAAFESAIPEYFAKEYSDRKKPPQLCYTDPQLVEQVAQDASDWFDGKPFGLYKVWSRAKRTWRKLQQIAKNYYPVVPMDNSSYCKCENCQKWYGKYTGNTYAENKGMYSNYIFNFVNQVAKKLKKEYPDRKVGGLAYAMYMDAPDKVQLEDNIMVMFCPVLRNVYSESRQKADKKMLRAWSETGASLYLWLYYCFPHERSIRGGGNWHVFPGFFAHSLARSLREYKKYDCKGMYFNGFGQEVEAYVTFAMLQDPEQNVDRLLDEYFSRMFGPAGATLRKLYCRIEEIYCDPNNYPRKVADRSRQNEGVAWGLLGNHDRMQELQTLINEAREKIKNASELQKQRFRLFDISTLKYIEQGRRKYVNKRLNPKTIGYALCAPLITSPKEGNLEQVDWNDAQGLKIWSSNYNENLASMPYAEVTHDGKFLYLRLRDLELKRNPQSGNDVVDGDYWQVMFMSKNDSKLKLDKTIAISPDGKIKDPDKLVGSIKSEVKGMVWTVLVGVPISQLPENNNKIYLNLAKCSPGMSKATLMPTMGKIDNPESCVVIKLEPENETVGQVSDDKLIARWNFSGSGKKVVDSSPGKSNFGMLNSNIPTRSPSPFGSSLNLNRRIGCEFFEVPNWSGTTETFTFSAWVNIDPVNSIQRGKLPYVLLSGKDSILRISDYMFNVVQGNPKMQIRSNRLLTPAEWEYVTLVVNKSGTHLYINGRIAGQSNVKFFLPPSGSSLRIGTTQNIKFHCQYRGLIANMEVFNRTMDSKEIMSRYQEGLKKIHFYKNR